MDQWLEVQAHTLLKTMWVITYERWFGPTMKGSVSNEAVVAQKLEELGQILDVYDARLSGNKYLAGPSFSLAEIPHMTSISYLLFAVPKEGTELLRSRPHVQAWWEDVTSRASWTKYLEEFKAALTRTGLA